MDTANDMRAAFMRGLAGVLTAEYPQGLEPQVSIHWVYRSDRDMDQQLNGRRMLAIKERFEELLGADGNPRDKRVVL